MNVKQNWKQVKIKAKTFFVLSVVYAWHWSTVIPAIQDSTTWKLIHWTVVLEEDPSWSYSNATLVDKVVKFEIFKMRHWNEIINKFNLVMHASLNLSSN